uniref:Putative ovule protein n=1 Tax=Solanum chacoense TaxID=4108 RepID=A0A0V0HDY0_SOLCH
MSSFSSHSHLKMCLIMARSILFAILGFIHLLDTSQIEFSLQISHISQVKHQSFCANTEKMNC